MKVNTQFITQPMTPLFSQPMSQEESDRQDRKLPRGFVRATQGGSFTQVCMYGVWVGHRSLGNPGSQCHQVETGEKVTLFTAPADEHDSEEERACVPEARDLEDYHTLCYY